MHAGAGGADSVLLTGVAKPRPAAATVEPQSVQFRVTAGSATGDVQSIRVTSAGPVPLEIFSVSLTPNTGPFRIVREECSERRPFTESQSCELAVEFRASEADSYNARLILSANTDFGQLRVPLFGVATTPPPPEEKNEPAPQPGPGVEEKGEETKPPTQETPAVEEKPRVEPPTPPAERRNQ